MGYRPAEFARKPHNSGLPALARRMVPPPLDEQRGAKVRDTLSAMRLDVPRVAADGTGGQSSSGQAWGTDPGPPCSAQAFPN